MDASVVICTFNRAGALKATLETLRNLDVPASLTWELLIIDNNSNDNTRDVCKQFQTNLPLVYVFEPKQGKSHALNTAVDAAKSDFLLFTDDDVNVERDWLTQMTLAGQRYPKAAYIGGRVIPRWQTSPPKWMADNSHDVLKDVAVCFDLGPKDQTFDDPLTVPIGANLALQRDVLRKLNLRFRTDIGPTGKDPVRGEESALIAQLQSARYAGMYCAGALVYHCNPPERMTEKYVRHWFKGYGMMQARTGQLPNSSNNWFGAPRYLYAQFAKSCLAYLATRWTGPSRTWLSHECRAATKWGAICEFRKQRH